MAGSSRSLWLTAFFGLALFAGRPALSQTPGKRLAVLEFNGAKTQGEVLEVFADTVRGGVVQGLAGRGIQVMTRENMMVLLREMGKNDCVEGDCEVETARNIGADFVISGSVVLVDQSFVVTLKLHESKGGSLLAVDQVSAQSQVEVLRQLREAGRRIVADNLGPRPGEPAAASWARAGRAVPGTAPTLIALVDLARLIKETPEGQAVRAKLKAVFDQKQRRLDDMQGELKKRIEAFKRDRGSLSPEAIAKGEASLQQEVTRIQDVYKTYQKELGDSEAELSKKLIDGTITPRLRALALASGSPTMLDAKAVAYFQRELDLTESAAARAASASLKPVRIARIDQKKVLTSVHEGVRAKAVLTRDFQAKQAELDRLQNETKRAKAKYDSESHAMTAEARRSTEEQLSQRVAAVQKLYQTLQQALAKNEETATAPILKRITSVLAKLARDRDLGLVYSTQDVATGVMFGKNPDSLQPRPVDLTDEAIAAYDAQFP
jgi:Skp family chaperone for outer membrane proteins/TolB-like protein